MAKERAKKVEKPQEETQNVPPEMETLVKNFANVEAENKMLKGRLAQAMEQMKVMSLGEVHKKLEWLWRVITLEGSNDIFGDDFVEMCAREFMEILTPAPEENEE